MVGTLRCERGCRSPPLAHATWTCRSRCQPQAPQLRRQPFLLFGRRSWGACGGARGRPAVSGCAAVRGSGRGARVLGGERVAAPKSDTFECSPIAERGSRRVLRVCFFFRARWLYPPHTTHYTQCTSTAHPAPCPQCQYSSFLVLNLVVLRPLRAFA